MRIQLKLAALSAKAKWLTIIALCMGLTVAIAWQARSILQAEKNSTTLQSLAREGAPFSRLLQSRAEQLRQELALYASRKEGIGSSNASGSLDSVAFDAIGWIENTQPHPALKWVEGGRKTINSEWLRGIAFSKVHDGEAYFIRRADADGNPVFALLTSAEVLANGATVGTESNQRVYLVGLLNSTAFSDVVDDWIGSSRVAYVFDDKGFVLAHTDRALNGLSFKDDELVGAALHSHKTFTEGSFDDSHARAMIAHSEAVAQTNLHLALGVSKHFIDDAVSVTLQKIVWGLICLFGSILAALAWILSRVSAHQNQSELNENSELARAATDRAPRRQLAFDSPIGSEHNSAATHVPQFKVERTPEVPATFESIEMKTRLNVKEMLEKSAAIRARLDMDFVETVSEVVAETNVSDDPASTLGAGAANSLEEKSAEEPRHFSIRRPKVSL